MPTKVSVVLASFNGARHILGQLESIAQQTLLPAEVLVSDDGSTDATIELVKAFAADAPFPLLLHTNPTRLGYAENFLAAAGRANGDVIAFCDQDDVWLPDKLASALTAFDDPEVVLWLHASRRVDEQLVPFADGRLHTGLARRAARLNPLHPLHGSHLAFRASLLKQLPPVARPSSVYGPHPAEHDEWVTFAAHVLGRIAWEPRPRMLYRQHAGSLTQTSATPTRTEVVRAGEESRHNHSVLAAAQRREYLVRRLNDRDSEAARPRLERAAEVYRRMTPRLRRRLRTRQSSAAVARVGSLVRSVLCGHYASRARGGLGAWALVEDLRAVRSPRAVPAGATTAS